jgi:hypothetical protein
MPARAADNKYFAHRCRNIERLMDDLMSDDRLSSGAKAKLDRPRATLIDMLAQRPQVNSSTTYSEASSLSTRSSTVPSASAYLVDLLTSANQSQNATKSFVIPGCLKTRLHYAEASFARICTSPMVHRSEDLGDLDSWNPRLVLALQEDGERASTVAHAVPDYRYRDACSLVSRSWGKLRGAG